VKSLNQAKEKLENVKNSSSKVSELMETIQLATTIANTSQSQEEYESAQREIENCQNRLATLTYAGE